VDHVTDVDVAMMMVMGMVGMVGIHQLNLNQQPQQKQLQQQQCLQQRHQIATEAAAQVVHVDDHVLFGGCVQDLVPQHAVIITDAAIQIQHLLHLNHHLNAAHVQLASHGRHVNHVDA
jgi:hypothetical protein